MRLPYGASSESLQKINSSASRLRPIACQIAIKGDVFVINTIWIKRGISLVFLAFAVALPISFFLPFFGVLFFLPFSDAVLLGLAALIAGFLPMASTVTRFMTLLLLWVALSLSLEVPTLPQRISDLIGGTNPGIRTNRPNLSKVPQETVSIVGAANPILAARGSKWQVQPELNVGGMRQSMGQPLINMATAVDLPDMLWSRGIEPRIGENSFPRLSISNVVSIESSKLKLEYLDAPDQVVATYERRLPLPKMYPGLSLDGARSLLSSVLYSNLWREVLQVNRPVDLNSEISNFLDIAVGTAKRLDSLVGPTRAIEIEQEQVVQLPEGRSVSQVFEDTNTNHIRAAGGNWQWKVCGQYSSELEFGGPGTSTNLLGLYRGDGSPPALLHHVSPDDAIFAFYCEPTTQHIIALSRLGSRQKPLLRIATYDSAGILQYVQMFLLPRWLGRGSFIVPGTWERIGMGEISFQLMERIRSVNVSHNEIEDQKSYRLLTLRAK